MFTPKRVSLLLAAAASLMLSAQALAEAPTFGSFRSIEFGADRAAMICEVRTDLATHIPAGSPVADARALLRAAGAHCSTPNAPGRIRCRYSDLHIEDDIIQDVSWTVDLNTADDKVLSFTVAREPASD